MKKQHINLLLNKKDYFHYEKYFLIFRYFVYFLGMSVIIFILYIFSIKRRLNIENSHLVKEKMEVNKYLQSSRSLQNDITYLSYKKGRIKSILKSDAHFYPYYKLLTETLKKATASASLSNLKIDSKRNTVFSVIFKSYEDMYNFLTFAESSTFLDNFSRLYLNNFLASSKKNMEYKLTFSGQFIKKIKYEE